MRPRTMVLKEHPLIKDLIARIEALENKGVENKDEPIVSMIRHGDLILVATQKHIYKLIDGGWEKLELELEEES